jgi:hypothetical protein
MIGDGMSQQVINKFKPFIFSMIELIIKHLTILFITVMILTIVLPLLASPPLNVFQLTTHQPKIYLMNGFVSASSLEEHANHSIDGPIVFNASGIIGESSTNAIYPAFNYSLTEINQPENKDLTTNSSFLPIPDLGSETGTPSHEASTAEVASEMTQSAIEKMVNPSSLLSSAIDDIRESGNNDADNSQDVQSAPNKTISFLNTEFSTIPLYGMNIPPKDYLIVSSDEVSDGERDKLFATARIPCNDKRETHLRVVLLENWSSIAYPPPKMHLIHGETEGQLCMFRIEYPENGIADSYITPTNTDKSSTRNPIASTAIALYNSGASALRFPMASSITISHLGSL